MARSRRRGPTLRQLSRMSPQKLTLILLILLVSLLAALWDQGWQGRARTGGVLEGSVARVVDGDTIVVAVVGEQRRVRLLGLDTPETVHPDKGVQPYGPEASAFTKARLTGRRVWLEYDVAPLDRYQRHLAYVWLTEPSEGEEAVRGGMFNAHLLLGGYARVMTIQPNSRYAGLFVKFQEEARRAGRGLWAETGR